MKIVTSALRSLNEHIQKVKLIQTRSDLHITILDSAWWMGYLRGQKILSIP